MSSDLLERRGKLELALSSTMVVIMSLMLIHFIRNEWKHKSHKVGLKFWKLPPHTLCVFIAFLLYLIFTTESMLLSAYWVFYAKPNHTFSAKLCLIHFTHLSPFTFGKVAMYLFWFVRLHQVFQSTWFAISVKKLKCLAIAFNIPITVTAWYLSLFEYVLHWTSLFVFCACIFSTDLSIHFSTPTPPNSPFYKHISIRYYTGSCYWCLCRH